MRCMKAWAIAALLCAVPLVMAQQTTLKADVPFPFVARNVSCLPGEYMLTRWAGKSPSLVQMWNTGAGEGVLIAGLLDSHYAPVGVPKLVFHRYGDRYFLREIHEVPSGRVALLAGKEERQLQVAGARQSRIVVLARLR